MHPEGSTILWEIFEASYGFGFMSKSSFVFKWQHFEKSYQKVKIRRWAVSKNGLISVHVSMNGSMVYAKDAELHVRLECSSRGPFAKIKVNYPLTLALLPGDFVDWADVS